MKIVEYGNNWLIEDQLDNELLNDIKKVIVQREIVQNSIGLKRKEKNPFIIKIKSTKI